MSLDLNKLLDRLDFPKDQRDSVTEETFNEFLDKTWTGKATVEDPGKIVGKVTGSIATNLKRLYGFTEKDITGKTPEEIAELGHQKLASELEATRGKLKEGSDKKVNDLLKQTEDYQKSINDYKSLSDNLTKEIDELKSSFSQRERNMKVSILKDQVLNSLQWSDSVDQFKKKGIVDTINEQYILDLDDQEGLIPKDRQGNRIKNEKGTGFLGYKELLEDFAAKSNSLKKNDVQQQKVNNFGFNQVRTQPQQRSNTNQKGQERIMRSEGALERLRAAQEKRK